MRIGIHAAQLGRLADSAAVRSIARSAEELGYASLWVLDRLPAATEPRSWYGGWEGVELPRAQHRALDPLMVLAVSAGATRQIRLGTSVLVSAWYPPALLARSLTSLDVLSDGRLTVGLGLGWSVDEFEAVGADPRPDGRRLEVTLDVLDAHWSEGPIAYEGPSFRIAPAHAELRPRQRPRPPLLLAASTPTGLDRIARRADGWNPTEIGPEVIAPMWAQVRDLAAGYGRDPDQLQLVVRANIVLTDGPVDGERRPFTGSVEQVAADLLATNRIGAHEVILGLDGDPGVDEALDACACIAEAAGMADPRTHRING